MVECTSMDGMGVEALVRCLSVCLCVWVPVWVCPDEPGLPGSAGMSVCECECVCAGSTLIRRYLAKVPHLPYHTSRTWRDWNLSGDWNWVTRSPDWVLQVPGLSYIFPIHL